MARIIDKHGNIPLFGKLSWANFIDWWVTLCLGLIIMLTTVKLGGVRPDTHLQLLPLYGILISLHGLSFAVNQESPKRLSHVPVWFVPALLWMVCSTLWLTPVPWLGWYEVVYSLQAFIVLWVLANNVRTRAHLWFLIIMSLTPATVATFNGFYQFFQNPGSMVDAMTRYPLVLNQEFMGQATGAFADPGSFAAFLLILVPSLIIAAAVQRLPVILRLLSLYIALVLLLASALTQTYWASFAAVLILALVPWFCFRKISTRLIFSAAGMGVSVVLFMGMVTFHPLFSKGIQRAATVEGEGVRLVLWEEALALLAESPLTGQGAGAFSVAFQQSPRVFLSDTPSTPHNDYLLVLSQLGLIGGVLFAVPSIFVLVRAWRTWRKEPYAIKPRDSEGTVMPPQRFFLSLGIMGCVAFGICMFFTFVFYVPALTLYGVLAFCILLKSSYGRRLKVPEGGLFRFAYLLLAMCAGGSFIVLSSHKLEAQALELRARQQLDHVVDLRVHVSGNAKLLDQVIVLYEDALLVDDKNVDAWIGLSSAVCQLYFRSPSDFDAIGARAVAYAEKAVDLSPGYWMAWAQLGVANAFYGSAEEAEASLLQALKLAPNNSNAHYYYASYLGASGERREQALEFVAKALEINPANEAARRLKRKLLIF